MFSQSRETWGSQCKFCYCGFRRIRKKSLYIVKQRVEESSIWISLCSLEGLRLKLKLQYFGHLMWRADSFEKTLMLGRLRAGGEGDDREWDGWMASLTQWTWVWEDFGSWWWTGWPGVLRFMGLQRVGHDWVTELNGTPNIAGILQTRTLEWVAISFSNAWK